MVDPVTARRLAYWGLLVLIWAVILFARLLPLNVGTNGWPGPNWTLLIIFAWVLRQPNFVPVFLTAALFFLDDMVFMRPPGLGAGLNIIGLEFLRSRARFSRELPFLIEWAMVASIISAVALATRLVSTVFVITQPALSVDIFYLVITIAAYPPIVLVSSRILGVRHASLGDVGLAGAKI